MTFILCSDHSFIVFWPDFCPSKLNPANNGGLNFPKYTPMHSGLNAIVLELISYRFIEVEDNEHFVFKLIRQRLSIFTQFLF